MSVTTWILLAAAGLIVVAWARRRASMITSEQAHELVGKGAALVDVRQPEEFAAGHIDGAINIPVGQLATRLEDLPATDRSIVVYCRSGVRSGRAKALLESRGYQDVHNLGGMHRW